MAGVVLRNRVAVAARRAVIEVAAVGDWSTVLDVGDVPAAMRCAGSQGGSISDRAEPGKVRMTVCTVVGPTRTGSAGRERESCASQSPQYRP